jgi:hypothetical protein
VHIHKLIFFSIVASLLSSLKIYFLPEFELTILILLFFYRNNMLFGSALIIILCSHHYVIPDEVYRFDSSSYPSIYTKKIGIIKIIDLVTVLFFLYSLTISKVKSLFDYRVNLNYPIILLLFCFLASMTYPIVNQNFDLLFFNLRNLILVISSFLLYNSLSISQISTISFLACYSWISKMFFSILLPADNPLYREIFGFKWNIYFAGDEYLTLGVYFISILFLKTISKTDINYTKLIKFLILISLILALVAQRKGALIYFFVIFILVHLNSRSKFIIYQNLLILLLPLSTFLFLLFVLPLTPDYIRIAFFDQSGLLNSSIESIYNIFNNNIWHSLYGIGPYSMYEVKGLDVLLDNDMAFGSEVGNTYRYMIWSLPFGRLFLNVGLFGSLIYFYFLIKNLKKPPYFFYLYTLTIPIFFLENLSPVTSLSIGFSFVIISKYYNSLQNKNSPIIT